MGHKHFFYTEPKDSNLMTLDEVKAGVRAFMTVAVRHPDELRIDLSTETAIVISGPALTESFRFQPNTFTDGACTGMFILENEYNCCETNRPHEDAVVEEMLPELREAVHDKLFIDD